MAPKDPLPATALYTRCDPDQFDFATTEELKELEDSLGQDRAVDAVRFGIGMRSDGYKMFALGPPGTGKHTLVRRCRPTGSMSTMSPSPTGRWRCRRAARCRSGVRWKS